MTKYEILKRANEIELELSYLMTAARILRDQAEDEEKTELRDLVGHLQIARIGLFNIIN